jgi:NADH:ubiquinone oxidoreductase subunit 3 (subunit A)
MLVRIIFALITFSSRSGSSGVTKQLESKDGFECGLDSLFHVSLGFCVRFFRLAILFLFVDLEIAFLIPFYVGGHFSTFSPEVHILRVSIVFLFLLLLLLVEKIMGGLS